MRTQTGERVSDAEIAKAVVTELTENPDTVTKLVKDLKAMKAKNLGSSSKRLACVLMNGFSIFLDVKSALAGKRSRGQLGDRTDPMVHRIISNLSLAPIRTTGKEA